MLHGVKTYPITAVLITVWILFNLFRSRRKYLRMRKTYGTLLKMDISAPHAQWIVFCGDRVDLIQSYVSRISNGHLRVLVVHPGEKAPEVRKCDRSIRLQDHEALDDFLSYRHVKVLINLLAASESQQGADPRSVMKTLDMVFRNMEEHSAGCMVTVSSTGMTEYAKHCTELVEEAKRKGRVGVHSQEVMLPEGNGMKALEDAVEGSVQAIAKVTVA